MAGKQRVIATDLDRTLIPNGKRRYSAGSMELFSRLLKENNIQLIFVTGRYRKQVEEAIKKYRLPMPDYVIGMVGTKIYQNKNGRLKEIKEWQEILDRKWNRYKREDVANMLLGIKGIREQKKIKLNDYKQSYNFSLNANIKKIIREIESELGKNGIRANVIDSIDSVRKIGYLDILPQNTSKDEALKFVLKKIKVKKGEVMYCGDSGNDLQVLTSGFKGVLVNNATDEFKNIVKSKGRGVIYYPRGDFIVRGIRLNGNYVSGIIEGGYYYGFFQ